MAKFLEAVNPLHRIRESGQALDGSEGKFEIWKPI